MWTKPSQHFSNYIMYDRLILLLENVKILVNTYKSSLKYINELSSVYVIVIKSDQIDVIRSIDHFSQILYFSCAI